ncbi:hypothetical protein SAMN05216200_10958 [Oceanicella actignis]|uniref:Uncharacterized protein n=2 Tax=Oceanicella actignis TaxID=1189325 RepID=A0A1M7TS11_9RHOB|nr:hypothetical protein LY05_02529 [Oceanicella actignis]SET77198.1 hypothetical protein SAMN04488119_10964 [Oceanicella actignis]SHN73539.1 hypothetical protein SAMN05216200_10958 [Oceanicella actignis]
MISIEDIIGMTGLTREEIDAVAEHEHIPEAAAAALADYLMHQEKGPRIVAQMIADDIRAARARGDMSHAAALMGALRHFLRSQNLPR